MGLLTFIKFNYNLEIIFEMVTRRFRRSKKQRRHRLKRTKGGSLKKKVNKILLRRGPE